MAGALGLLWWKRDQDAYGTVVLWAPLWGRRRRLELPTSGFLVFLEFSLLQSTSVARGTLVPSASVIRPWGLEIGAEKQKKWDRVMRTPLSIIRKAPATTKAAVCYLSHRGDSLIEEPPTVSRCLLPSAPALGHSISSSSQQFRQHGEGHWSQGP